MEVFSDNKGATKAVVKFDYKGYLFSLTSFTPEPELGVFASMAIIK